MAGERLRVLTGSAAGAEASLPDGEFTVGRDEPGMGNLGGDPEISRHHARFRRLASAEVIVEDLGSTNGTYVNGQRISGAQVLSSGDRLTLGMTTLQFEAGVPAGVPASVSPPPGPRPSPLRRAMLRRALLVGVLGGVAVGAVVAIIALSGGGRGGATAPPDCGANIGKDGTVAYVAYVESNIPTSNQNSVIAIPYRAGDMKPLKMSQCATGGSGSTDLTDSGVLDANDQIIVNQQRTLLFAVNQGSDSIAVFHIGSNGALTPVPGSPYPSGGAAPSSLGLSGSTLVVANKAQDGVRDLKQTAPTYTTLNVAADGRLTPVSGSTVAAQPGSSPTDASVPPQGGVAFGTEESGPIRGFAISPSGVLTQAPGSPYSPPASAFAPGFDPAKVFALGVAVHPSQPYVYIGLPTIPALAVYSFDKSGTLTFVKAVPVGGAYLPCWIQVTRDGHWLYTSNADTDNVSAFDISNPVNPQQIQTAGFQTAGNPWNEALDPTSKFLFVNTPRDTLKVPEGEGNTQHVMSVGADGKLTELNAGSPVRIPVPKGANPQGVAVIPGPGAPTG